VRACETRASVSVPKMCVKNRWPGHDGGRNLPHGANSGAVRDVDALSWKASVRSRSGRLASPPPERAMWCVNGHVGLIVAAAGEAHLESAALNDKIRRQREVVPGPSQRQRQLRNHARSLCRLCARLRFDQDKTPLHCYGLAECPI